MNGICTRCGTPIQGNHYCPECGFLPGEDLDPWLGEKIDGFTLVRTLSNNPSSSVYEAKRGKERAAIKILRSGLDAKLTERFQREAIAIQRLNHPTVVKPLSQGLTGIFPFIAMELIEGETLLDRIQRRIFTEDELKALLKPLCEALEEAHQKGIVHRDLTPRNIMLERDNSPRLLDFGFAILRGEETLTERGVVSSAPAFMAFEQWQRITNASPRSDLYSLGVIAYLCLSGQLPISTTSLIEWLRELFLNRRIDLKTAMNGRDLSESMYRAIMRALQKNPNDRQASVAAFFSELF